MLRSCPPPPFLLATTSPSPSEIEGEQASLAGQPSGKIIDGNINIGNGWASDAAIYELKGITMGKLVTDDEVRSLFHLWNDALATLDPKAVTRPL